MQKPCLNFSNIQSSFGSQFSLKHFTYVRQNFLQSQLDFITPSFELLRTKILYIVHILLLARVSSFYDFTQKYDTCFYCAKLRFICVIYNLEV